MLEYRLFEGVLEAGQEGIGPVLVWDEGTYRPEREKGKGVWEEISDRAEAEAEMREGLGADMLKFRLFGSKLKGSFALIRTRGRGPKVTWLLIKRTDGYTQAGYDAITHDYSAVSGHARAEIATESDHPA